MCLGLRHLAAGPTLCGAGGPRRRGGAPWRILPSSWILLVLVAASGFTLADKPPRFIVEPESKIVKVHSEVRLHCRVEPASATVRWKWDGVYLNLDDQKDMHTEGSTLVIRPFRHRAKEFSHTGAYQCVASTGAGSIISRNATLERASLAQFEEGPGDIYVNATEGNVALVPCLPPQGNPPPVTSFAVNNTMLDINPERHMIMPSGNLQIAKVRQGDQGTYQCVATNPVTGLQRRAPSKVHLKVIAPIVNSAPRIVRAPNPVEVIADGNLTLECVVEGSPVPVVTWEKFGGQLPEGRYTQKLGNLIIHEMEYVDGGTYICRAAGGSGRSNVYSPTKVEVLEPPKIKVPPRDTVVKVGSTVTLHCQAQTNERVQSETRWLHNAQSVTPDRSTVITETSLSIHNVQKSHAGMYQCLARNKLGTVYAAAWLQVRDPSENITAQDLAQASNQMQDIAPDSLLPPSRPTIQVPPANMTVVSGASIVLPCTPQKVSPDMEIVWHKDAKPITPRQTFAELSRKASASDADSSREGTGSSSGSSSMSRYKVAPSSGALQIFNARPEDGGQFTCILSNQGGLDTATAYLTVPDPSTTSRTGGAVLKTPPTGSVNIHLPVTSSPGHVNVTKILEEPGENPSGRGRGRGDRGRGRGGKKKGKKKGKKGGKKKKDPPPREPTGDAKLVPPSKPEVSKLSDTSVLLKWDVPENDGLPITFFKVQYKNLHPRESRHKGWHTLDEDINSNTRHHEVVGLHPGSTYKFRVVGVYSNNDNKQGPNSARFTLAMQGVKHLEPPVECPVIVGARPLSATEIRIEWQYLDVHQSPIEGFKVLYKPFHSTSEFQAQTIPFPDQRVYTITGLWPSTEYTLNMQSFNHAGSSVLSNTVVKRTLATSDLIDVTPGFIGGPVVAQPSLTTTVVTVYQPNPINTQSSSELLYTVLGVVLGVMMLLLIIFMILCGWKQRQQRQMMAALNANIRKFDDPSKSIYIDSMRKKYGYTGGFVLNGITPTMTNGHAPPVTNGHIPIPNYTSEQQQNNHSGTLNGSKINISVNPLTAELDSRNMDDSGHPSLDNDEIPSRFSDYDPNNDGSETDSRNGQSIAELRSSLKEALSQTVPGLQPNYGEITYGSVENSCPPPADSGEELTPPEFYSPPDEGERLYDPPDYNSVQRISPDELSPPLRTTSYDHDMVVVPRRQSHEHIPLTNMSQSDRLSTFTRGSPARTSGDQGGEGIDMDPVEVSLRGHAKPHRRRRRRHRDQSTKEMATNTDMSSNEGTLDQPRYNTLPHQPRNVPRWDPPSRTARTPSPVSSPHFTSELLDYTKVPPYRGHNGPTTNTTSLLAYTDLPRVHDYPPSPDEDGEYGN